MMMMRIPRSCEQKFKRHEENRFCRGRWEMRLLGSAHEGRDGRLLSVEMMMTLMHRLWLRIDLRMRSRKNKKKNCSPEP